MAAPAPDPPDRDGVVTDADLARVPVPSFWRRLGLHGPRVFALWLGRNAKRMFVFVVGVTILAAGAAMLVLPGPGFVVLFVGLAVLASEFAWAERVLDNAKGRGVQALSSVTDSRTGRGLLVLSGVGLVVAGLVTAFAFDVPSLGVSLCLAGAAGLAVLTPPVQRWVARHATA